LVTSFSSSSAQESKNEFEDKSVTVELLLVEYVHEDGFNWGIDINNAQRVSNRVPDQITDASLLAGDTGSANLSFNYDVVSDAIDSTFRLNLQALVKESYARIAQNPRVTVTHGESAEINIKDERWIQLQSASQNGLTTELQKLDAGIDLKITPTVVDDLRINLDVEGSISEFQPAGPDGEHNIESSTINTIVTMNKDQTLVIGGLIKEVQFNLESGTPFLRKIPGIGKLFTRIEKTKRFKEVVIYLTVYIDESTSLSESKYSEKSKLFKQKLWESSFSIEDDANQQD